jgi:hypothetical protein
MGSTLVSCLRRKDVCSEPPVMTSESMPINDLPEEILLNILSHFGREDLCLIIARVCEKWNALAEDMILWKKLSYDCDRYSDISNIKEVRCTALLGFRTN